MFSTKFLQGYMPIQSRSEDLELPDEESVEKGRHSTRPSSRRAVKSRPWLLLTTLITFMFGLLSGFILSQTTTSPHPRISHWPGKQILPDTSPSPKSHPTRSPPLTVSDDSISTHETVLHYNKTFSLPPSETVEAAWRSIFPPGRGFIHDPTASSKISGLAVFHELHCLDAIRHALYEIQGISSGGTGEMAHAEHHDLHHVRHCFDYLRQSLMCHADTNLEPVDFEVGGVTGWGSKRTCRDYNEVVAMATRLRTHDQTEIS